jgi:subtilisin family serine protease
VVSAIALVAVPTISASAASADDGLWYFSKFNVQAAHDAGFTGKGVTIAILDSAINLDVPTLQGADIRLQPSRCYGPDGKLLPVESTEVAQAAHGTNVVSLIVGSGAGYAGQVGVKGVAPDATILYWRDGFNTGVENIFDCLDKKGQQAVINDPAAAAVNEAVAGGADIISVSAGLGESKAMVLALANAVHAGVVVIGSLPNSLEETAGLVGTFPESANGAVSVQSGGADAQVQMATSETEIVGPGMGILVQGVGDSWEAQDIINGTSLATPIVAGFLALVKQKYPDATGNQLIQTLIRNTWAEDHPLEYDSRNETGYGFASVTHMLRVDPTQYEDVNPLIVDDGIPSAEMIANPPSAEEYLGTEDGNWETPEPTDKGLDLASLIVPVGLGILGLLVLAGIITTIVLATRRARTPSA